MVLRSDHRFGFPGERSGMEGSHGPLRHHFVVDDVHVSRYHARLIRDENGHLFIEDTDSENGTYVNGDRVIKKKVVPSDVIMLGDHYVLDIMAVLKSDNDYSEEFAALKPVYERYIKEKIRIQSTNQFKTRIFQSLPFAFVGVAGLIIGVLGKHHQGIFIGSLTLAICAPTLGIYLGASNGNRRTSKPCE